MLTLFGLVLAIGIVVDDAIVIVENAAHHIEQGHAARARRRSRRWREVTGPIIGITLVLMAVFLPDGVPGRHHRPALPPVRPDHRRHGAHQRHQRPDAQAGPVRASYLRPHDGAEERLLPRLQLRLRPRRAASTPRSSAAWSGTSSLMMLAVRRRWSALTGWWYTRAADRLPADRGPGLRHRRRAAARRRLAGADRARWSTRSTRSSQETPGVDNWFVHRRLLAPRRQRRLERGDLLRRLRRRGRSGTTRA